MTIVVLFNGCAFDSITNPQKDMARFLVPGVKAEEPSYKRKAVEFVEYAEEGDLQSMLRITSPQATRDNGGPEALKTIFEEIIIPKFIDSEVTWKGGAKAAYDKDYDVGLGFKGIATKEGQTYKFMLYVFEENGELFFRNIRKRSFF